MTEIDHRAEAEKDIVSANRTGVDEAVLLADDALRVRAGEPMRWGI